MSAIIEFLGGEKAYAKIIPALPSEITITLGEHSTDKGEKISPETWLLQYDKKEDNWKGSYLLRIVFKMCRFFSVNPL
ncbi:hypothetical protein K2F45_16470 [Sphingobacterium siyangense]|uniref:hypothetical protein n=1 Tax=Sphingobacterium siyangense TaxID=459529 RepID=UPI00200E566A|nr:hypothetical protein [Sphingobacterium siyangense]UQA73419.1 hypothetical protein K2F45_16470 [Sphingobacterium siyangense]